MDVHAHAYVYMIVLKEYLNKSRSLGHFKLENRKRSIY